ncbi:MAG: cell division protein FtsL [Gammaproteobacteria bacterium]|nr:MAG: cell division protein FtsL [Gammaproteobacteria bacterium]
MRGVARKQAGWLFPLLWIGVIVSALSVVYVSHLCRQLYNELAKLEQEANALQVEWGRYLLEQSSWASLSRVEQMAINELNMRVPEPSEIVIVRAGGPVGME